MIIRHNALLQLKMLALEEDIQQLTARVWISDAHFTDQSASPETRATRSDLYLIG